MIKIEITGDIKKLQETLHRADNGVRDALYDIGRGPDWGTLRGAARKLRRVVNKAFGPMLRWLVAKVAGKVNKCE